MIVLVNRDPKWFFILVLEVGATLVLSLLPLCGWLVVEAMIALVVRVNPLVVRANLFMAYSNIKDGGWAGIYSPVVIVESIEDRCMMCY